MLITNIHPNEMPELLAFAQSVFDSGSGWTNELTCTTKEGATLPAEISASVIDLAGRTYMIALVRDITERKRAEAALHESEERLSRILESAMDAIITIDDTQRVTLFNEAAEQVFRCPAMHVIGQPFDRFLSNRFRTLLSEYLRASHQSGMTKRYLYAPEGLTALRADGEEFPIEATISQVNVGRQKLYTVILRDMDERKRAEAELSKLQLENLYLQEEIKAEHNFEEIIGTSAALKKVLKNSEKVAGTDSTVLLTGETGTGKELIASIIHNLSKRKNRALIKVNCAALPTGLIESELFGHEKGAFTGAIAKKIGRFELADGGTLFLDEIGDLPPELQAKLLRVLQGGEFERVGGTQTIKVDARVIAATNRDIKRAMEDHSFRADLYYRLNVFPVHLPPLRERKEDMPLLAQYFLSKYARRMDKRIEQISPDTMARLIAYPWPGNIRELQNVIERAVILSPGPMLEVEEGFLLPSNQPAQQGKGPMTLEEVERVHIISILDNTMWVIDGSKGAAKILNLHPNTLRSRMQKLSITRAPHEIS